MPAIVRQLTLQQPPRRRRPVVLQFKHPHDAMILPNGDMVVATWAPVRPPAPVASVLYPDFPAFWTQTPCIQRLDSLFLDSCHARTPAPPPTMRCDLWNLPLDFCALLPLRLRQACACRFWSFP